MTHTITIQTDELPAITARMTDEDSAHCYIKHGAWAVEVDARQTPDSDFMDLRSDSWGGGRGDSFSGKIAGVIGCEYQDAFEASMRATVEHVTRLGLIRALAVERAGCSFDDISSVEAGADSWVVTFW